VSPDVRACRFSDVLGTDHLVLKTIDHKRGLIPHQARGRICTHREELDVTNCGNAMTKPAEIYSSDQLPTMAIIGQKGV
jgi:hypothetical protein